MLSEDEKLHIREEEILRSEIRKELDGAESRGSKSSAIWKFVNSAFFLWFASSVLIAAASFLYSRWEKQQAVEQERSLTARKLDAEIASRLRYFSAMYELSISHEARRVDLKLKALLGLEKPSEAEYPVNVFPEYANWSFTALLWELTRVVPENEKKGIDTADSAASKLSSMYLFWREVGDSAFSVSDMKAEPSVKFEKMQDAIDAFNHLFDDSKILNSLNLDRWGKPLEPTEPIIQTIGRD
jgi:hypothetical protein